MAESSQSSPVEPSAFGANEWLVDEMFERYQQDPNSVDKAWWEFFKNYTPGEHVTDKPTGPNGARAAAQKTAEKPAAEKTASKPTEKAAPKPAEKPAAPTPQAKSAATAKPRSDETPAKAAPKTSAPVPKEPEPAAKAEAKDEPQLTVLRGAPARTAQNMDVSLSVPTATSVRSVPVKLLWDNRTVINNHLARARGGKVSFTHIIGYALVKALKTMPEMNNGFDVIDGKPTLITPAHINLGLAIDMQKPDGTRQLLVPSIKAAETMDFAAFWTAYEDIVRKARNNKLAVYLPLEIKAI